MAHKVKCYYCGVYFDADKEEYTKPTNNRYAHIKCSPQTKNEKMEKEEKPISTEKQERKELLDCINEICLGISIVDWARIQKDIKRLEKEGYTLSGLRKTLKYYYTIKKNPVPKEFNSLYIATLVYSEASEYYKNIYLINQKNKDKEYNTPEKKIVQVRPPKERTPQIKFFNIGE